MFSMSFSSNADASRWCRRGHDAETQCIAHGAKFPVAANRCLTALLLEQLGHTNEFAELRDRIDAARMKFPSHRGMYAALSEELGELARAIEGDGDIRSEALDTACVAMRIYTEGDATPATADEYREILKMSRALETAAREALAKLEVA